MATVICKRTILFRNESKATISVKTGDGKTELQLNPNAPKHLISASKDPQEIPDWVTQQPAFRHAVEHGEIMLIQVKKPVKAEVVEKTPLPENSDAGTAQQQAIEVPLEKLNKGELLLLAQKRGIVIDDKLKKDEILAALKQETTKT